MRLKANSLINEFLDKFGFHSQEDIAINTSHDLLFKSNLNSKIYSG